MPSCPDPHFLWISTALHFTELLLIRHLLHGRLSGIAGFWVVESSMWLRRFLGGDLCTHLTGIYKSPRKLVPALVTPDWIVYTYQPGDYDSVTIDKL